MTTATATREKIEEGWPEWTADLLQRIARGDMDAAANMLVCSTIDQTGGWWGPEDDAGYRTMFQHPEVLRNAKVLWLHMEPMLLQEAVGRIRNDMIEVGWALD